MMTLRLSKVMKSTVVYAHALLEFMADTVAIRRCKICSTKQAELTPVGSLIMIHANGGSMTKVDAH